MQQTHWRKAEHLKKRKDFMSSVKGVSHLSRRAKRRLYCKLQFWMWRKRREKSRFVIFRSRRHICGIRSSSRPCLRLKMQLQNNKTLLMYHALNTQKSQLRTSALVSPTGCDAEGSEDALRSQNGLATQCEAVGLSDALAGSRCSQVTDASEHAGTVNQTIPGTTVLSPNGKTWLHPHKLSEKPDHTASPLQCTDGKARDGNTCCTLSGTQRLVADSPSKQHSQTHGTDTPANERLDREKTLPAQADVDLGALTRHIQDFLDGFYRRYGSFIPLHKSDVLRHLRRKFDCDFSDRKTTIFSEVSRCQNAIAERTLSSFRVVYKKHVLTLEDLLTLADQNWLNDQVMNMYGELIMESSHHKVHFLNSFFHRQLMTKGYDGVKRWTKQVDLFSKSLLLVPVHLEVHWCLVTAEIATKKICLYDSQGNALQKVARNILKYLMTEAKEKQQTTFQDGWTVSLDEEVPQQTNENDCGVFVLEYSRCLALSRPFQFSQRDIPKIRKRIYKELCDCKLHEQG